MKTLKLLGRFTSALRELGRSVWWCDEVEFLFAIVAESRPDLLERSLFAERARSTLEMERLLKLVSVELIKLQSEGKIDENIDLPDFDTLRLNHSTKTLHQGHSYRCVKLFP